MSQLSSRVTRALAAAFVVTAVIAACGSENGSTFDPNANKDGGTSGSTGSNGASGSNGNSNGSIGGDGGSSGANEDGGSSGAIDPNCKRLTCADQSLGCGEGGDGCGGKLNCDPIDPATGKPGCGDGKRCGGPGAPSQCVTIEVATSCTPMTCADQKIGCGQTGDGCGNLLECGGCNADEQCGATGRPSQCVKVTATEPDGGTCVKKTVADYATEDKDCGMQSDGCGGTLDLGSCKQAGEFCGNGGPSKCAAPGGGSCQSRIKTCADYPADICGKQPDGCGGLTADCGTCTRPEVCGGGGVPSHCGGGVLVDDAGNTCKPRTACGTGLCGTLPDGCGGVLDCGTTNCKNGDFCGGGGTQNQCGKPACQPGAKATVCAGKNCGVVGDGCGGIIDCTVGAGCTGGQICGANNQPNVCGAGGVTADGGAGGGPCIPKTAATCTPGQCGPIADTCGGSFICGSAFAPDYCPNAGDTCGGGTAANPGTPSQCGGACVKKDPVAACTGQNCGFAPDGCGGSYTCGVGAGACPSPSATGNRKGDVCGGGGPPNVCGGGAVCPAGSLCNQQPSDCPGGVNTSAVEGVVYMPNGFLPVYNALVYVPDAPLPTMPTGNNGVCEACSSQATSPLVNTRTDYKGYFSLTNIPVGNNIPLVIQSGRWRKLIHINNSAKKCGTLTMNTLGNCDATTHICQAATANNTTFGTTQTADNNIPKFAVTTGGADALQCLLRKIGIADSEFTPPGGSGRVNVYGGDQGTDRFKNNFNGLTSTNAWSAGAPNTRIFAREVELYGNKNGVTKLDDYDAVVLSCNGGAGERNPASPLHCSNNGNITCTAGGNQCSTNYGNCNGQGRCTGNTNIRCANNGQCSAPGTCNPDYTPAEGLAPYRANMKNYADVGGKIFASHWHYAWLKYGPGLWDTTGGVPNGKLATISATDADLRDPITAAINMTPTKNQNFADWLINSNTIVGNTPSARGSLVIRDAQHQIFATDSRTTQLATIGAPVPREGTCSNNNGRACNRNSDCQNGGTCSFPTDSPDPSVQHFDFLTPVFPVNATPGTQCGRFVLSDIHIAAGGDTVGNGGSGQGFPDNCTAINPQTMLDQERTLAFAVFDLTSCAMDPPDGPKCTKLTCASPQNVGKCGKQSDGCGGLTAADCNPCNAPATCGGGGQANVCGTNNCIPKACPAGTCSTTGGIPDGCGGLAPCAACAAGQTCGGGGQANKCGTPTCTPLKCGDPGVIECGKTGDGCGGTLDCVCKAGTCGGAGVPNKCGVCTKQTKCPAGLTCGLYPDGCGGAINCGICTGGDVCGGGGTPNVCGHGSCTAKSCVELGAECGQAGDGCGGTQKCPDCSSGDFCNAQNLCVPPTCQPSTCADLKVDCGPVSDGCGGLAKNAAGVAGDCGSCPTGQACGANGQAGKCGTLTCNPLTCQDTGAICGQVANGCGGLTPQCGPTCPGTQSCVNGACVNACTPRQCADVGAQCGFVADGCGGTVDCGACDPGQLCGYNNQANKCGSPIVK